PLAATVEADLQLKRAEGKASLPLPQLLRLRTRGRIAGQRIELADLQLQGGGHALATRGWLDLERQSFDLAVELASGALAPVLAGFGLQGLDGRASFAGRVQGRVDDPRVQGQLAVQQLQLLGLQLGRIDCALTLQQGTLSLGGLRSQGSWGVLRLDGRLGLWRRSVAEPIADPPVQLSGRLEEMDLAMLLPQALRGKGKLGAELSARGSLDHLDAELSVQAGNVELVGLGLDHFTLQATAMRDGALLGVKVPRLDLALQHGGGLVASGELRSDRTFTLDLRAEGLPVAELDRLTGLKRGLSGKVTFGLHGEGPLLAPRVSGDLLLRGLQMELPAAEEEDAPRRYAFGDASLHLELGEDQRLRIGSGKAFGFFDLAAELPVTLSARTPVALEQATARVTFAELALEQLVPGLAEREVQGKLTGGVTVTLPDGNPSILLEISRVELDVLGQQLSNRPAARPAAASGPAGAAGEALPLRFAFDGRQLRIEQLALQSGGRPLALAGTVTLDADGDTEATALDLRASGELDLAMLRPFLPDLPRLGGTLDFQLTLGGSLAAPQLVGFLGVQGAGFQLAALGQELALERGRILFLPGKIAIPGSAPLVGRLGRRGAFSLTAEVEVPRLWPPLVPSARLTLHGERLRISLPDEGMMLMLDIPQVELAATDVLAPERHIEVSGEVRLAQGQLNRSYTDPEELAAAFRGWFEGLEQTQSRGLPKGHPLQALRLRNLKIAGEQGALQVQVQAAILSLRLHLKPDLALTGPLESLRITGSVETQEDDAITLMDREFRLTHSDIRFDGSTSPLVEMEAEAQVIAAPLGGPSAQQHEATAFSAADEEERTYHITLLLEGRLPDDLEKFELTSPQTSDQRELWTLLLLGYRYSDLTRSGQRGDVGSEVLLSSALQILSQKISEKALKQFQLVDQLQLLSQHQDVKVQVSKKVLGGKLELLGSGTFSGQAETQGSLGAKLYLRERLFLEFSTTQDHEQNPMSSRLGWQVPLD
ncbi:MAG: hypothetical protein FJ125_06540, partial [Deltaproteobacteria bacterium]|nr:hypothetical protein [Deltaproteobacteria bacterium]